VTVDDKGYSPAVFVLQKGIPARIKFVASKLSSCNQYVDFPDYGGGLDLGKGELATPLLPVSQDFVFQCGMAMLHGYVRVVDNLDSVDLALVRTAVKGWKPAAGSGGMSCCAPPAKS
jgi:plastocyanin domain-containing protein